MRIHKKGVRDGVERPVEDFRNSIDLTIETVNGRTQIHIVSLPVTFHEALEKKIPRPKPPMKPVTVDGKSKRDHRGLPQLAPDWNDETWKARHDDLSHLHAVAIFHAAVSEDKELEWETKEAEFTDEKGAVNWEGFYRSINAELDAAQFQFGVFAQVVAKVNEISGVDMDRLEQLSSFFLGRQGL